MSADCLTQQIIILTDATLEVVDVRTMKAIESVPFNSLGLLSPTLVYTHSNSLAYQDSIRDIHHSIKTYKGKLFTLVSLVKFYHSASDDRDEGLWRIQSRSSSVMGR